MNYMNLDALVADTSNFNNHFQGQARNDNNTYSISITDSNLTDFKIRSGNVNKISMNGDGYVYFATSSNTQAATLRVNQRDMSSWNMWYQYGTVGLETKFNFVRVRWEGQSRYGNTYDNAAGKLIFNVILLSNHNIYLIIEKWPTSDATGTNTFYYGSTITYSPSTTNLKFCFVPSNANGTSWSLMSTYAEPKYVELLKYFIKDGSDKLYSLVDGSLTEISEMTEENGMDSLPSYDAYKNLVDPSVLILSSYNQVNPEMKEKYMPDHIDHETEDYICDFKVNRVWITSDDTTKFQVSFDGGVTWLYYTNNAWVDSTNDITVGNTKTEAHDIPMTKWQQKNTSDKIRFRWRFTSTDQHIDKIEIGNQKSYEDIYGEVCPY